MLQALEARGGREADGGRDDAWCEGSVVAEAEAVESFCLSPTTALRMRTARKVIAARLAARDIATLNDGAPLGAVKGLV